MTTRIWLTAAATEAGEGHHLDLKDEFDVVIRRIHPDIAPSSSKEMRDNFVHTRTDGRRVMVHPQLIGWVEEDATEEDLD